MLCFAVKVLNGRITYLHQPLFFTFSHFKKFSIFLELFSSLSRLTICKRLWEMKNDIVRKD